MAWKNGVFLFFFFFFWELQYKLSANTGQGLGNVPRMLYMPWISDQYIVLFLT